MLVIFVYAMCRFRNIVTERVDKALKNFVEKDFLSHGVTELGI